MTEYLVARDSAVIRDGKLRRVLTRNKTVVRTDDPLVAGREHLFRPLDERTVEQASAAPGERRNVESPSNRAIREWAAEMGYELPARRKVPADVVEAYHAAHAEQE